MFTEHFLSGNYGEHIGLQMVVLNVVPELKTCRKIFFSVCGVFGEILRGVHSKSVHSKDSIPGHFICVSPSVTFHFRRVLVGQHLKRVCVEKGLEKYPQSVSHSQ